MLNFTKSLILAAAIAAISSVALADHHNLPDACRNVDEVPIPDAASYAVYYDRNHNKVILEDLAGVSPPPRNVCALKRALPDCGTGYCMITIDGVNYCKRCR